MNRIYWTPISADERPDADIVIAIDGVKYNYLRAIHDSQVGIYSCERNDYRMPSITPDEAQVCMDLLANTCEKVLPEMCEVVDLSDVERIKNQVMTKEIVLDEQRSCGDATSTSYGLYEKDVDQALALSDGTDHCSAIIQETCSQLDSLLKETEAADDDSCADDPSFVLHGSSLAEELEAAIHSITGSSSTIKNCAWVAEDAESRCKARSNHGDHQGKRAFEFCRSTCNTCKCSDTGNEDEKCCRDNKEFLYQDDELKSCDWVGKNPNKKAIRCGKRAVARNCPQTCGYCPA